MSFVVFTVEGPPQGKGRPRFRRAGNFVTTYTDQKTKDYELRIKHQAMAAMGSAKPSKMPIDLSIQICCSIPCSWSKKKQMQALGGEIFPTNKPDIDNILKAVSDAMNGVVYDDDRQIISVRVVKYYGQIPHLSIKVGEHE
jgi:Holliday junction resolvase RusA-like endonuclease